MPDYYIIASIAAFAFTAGFSAYSSFHATGRFEGILTAACALVWIFWTIDGLLRLTHIIH